MPLADRSLGRNINSCKDAIKVDIIIQTVCKDGC
jgi:hypothetical protein